MFGFFSGIFGKIKTAVILVLAAALPLLYVFGRRDGSTADRIDRLKQDRETNAEIADFYRRMAEEPLRDPVRDRRDLVDRLREGL